jgi:AraC-like DNA-binding protein
MIILNDVREQIITSRDLMTFRGHAHGELEELLICLEGIAAVKIEGLKTIFLTPGWGLLLEPGPEHMIWDGSREKNTRYYNAYYKGHTDIFSPLVNIPFNTNQWEQKPFWKEFNGRPERQEVSLYRILGLLLTLEENLDKENPIKPREIKAQTAGENIREQLRRIILSDLSKNHRLTDLGQEFHLEPKYLSAKVKRITSLPVMTLYYQVKMGEATTLLQRGESVKETAYGLGFANPYHFSRKYKEICGRSPSRVFL